MNSTYETWVQRYSGEDFDRAQDLAQSLTDADRAAGLTAPAYGYSQQRWAEASRIVRAANAYA